MNSLKWWYLTNFGTSKITVVPARGPHLSHSGVAFLVMMENFIRTSFEQSNLISAATSVLHINPLYSIACMQMFSMELAQVIVK